jgi:hypothetical protein
MTEEKKKPVVLLTSNDIDIRFVVIRACIRSAKNAGWKYGDIHMFAARTANAPDYEKMMLLVKEQFEVVVNP